MDGPKAVGVQNSLFALAGSGSMTHATGGIRGRFSMGSAGPGREPDWDAEVASLLKIPEKPYSRDPEAALELTEVLRRRGFRSVTSHRADTWVVELHRQSHAGWPAEPIGARGATFTEALVKAAFKVATLLAIEEDSAPER